ncbi:MAG: MaoC family dehydratase [Chloroflexi bacterium]|nr:MaoC family dehydratase [Chloroflexota bacterium]
MLKTRLVLPLVTVAFLATGCGETEARFLDPNAPGFRAVPNYASNFHGRRNLPENFPANRLRSFDAGKCVESFAPIRPGDTITGRSHIHDIYEKTGRSGPMMFIVHRMEFTNQDDVKVAIVDWRLVMRLGYSLYRLLQPAPQSTHQEMHRAKNPCRLKR